MKKLLLIPLSLILAGCSDADLASHKYILVGHKAVPEPNIYKWGEWFEKADRRVGMTTIGDFTVYTSFLGFDHSFGDGPPLIFETMAKNNTTGDLDDFQERYSSWEEAEEGHKKAVEIFSKK